MAMSLCTNSFRSAVRALCIVVVTAAFAAPPDSRGAAPITGLADIATGGWHTCAVTVAGSAQCWGWNFDGQLGRGDSVDSTVPVNVSGLASGVRAVAAGSRHSCALMNSGTVKCWGENFYGQLGVGGPFPSTLPVDVPSVSGLVTIAAGGHHACGLTSTGGVRCWGNDSWGQLGGNALTSGIVAVATGYQHGCALTDGGGVKCWGANYRGQLGIGVVSNSVAVPTDVAGLGSGVVAIAAGATHSCAALAGGSVRCWGSGDAGALGNGTTDSSPVPVDVQGVANVVELALGEAGSCALASSGGVKCWGANAGNGSALPSLVPVDVTGLPSGVTAIASGFQHVCARLAEGAARCWGANSFGALGNGQVGRSVSPVDASGLANVTDIATGADHSCALTANGVVHCWGRNFGGAVGSGTIEDAFVPTPVPLGSSATAVGAGGYASCAVTAGGGVKCWGLMSLTPQLDPTDVAGLPGVVDVAVGSAFACALTAGGAVKCWGSNHLGQLGDGSTAPSTTPVDAIGLSANVVAIGTGDWHACALLGDGSVRCWGGNDAGQVTASTGGGFESTPVTVGNLGEAVLALDLGRSHSCVRTASSAMRCWGSNGNAQFGLGHQYPLPGVHAVPLPNATVSLAAGEMHSCQAGDDGTVRCWGQNNEGQVGSGTPIPFGETSPAPVFSPVQVAGIAGATALSSAGRHTCAIANGAVKCWGANGNGQLGNGVAGYTTAPEPVLAGNCHGFDDVAADSPFCANVAWNRNRLVTQGCVADRFCPDEILSRLAMAAFANRLGSALTPVVARAEQTPGAIDPAPAIVVCETAPFETASQRRRVQVDASLRALSAVDSSFATRVVMSEDGGAWSAATSQDLAGLRAGLWSNQRLQGNFDIAENRVVRFGIEVSRTSLPPGPPLADSSCLLRARISNAN